MFCIFCSDFPPAKELLSQTTKLTPLPTTKIPELPTGFPCVR